MLAARHWWGHRGIKTIDNFIFLLGKQVNAKMAEFREGEIIVAFQGQGRLHGNGDSQDWGSDCQRQGLGVEKKGEGGQSYKLSVIK